MSYPSGSPRITVMEFELPPAGIYCAVCAEVGTYNVKKKNFDTGLNEMADQVIFSFEIEATMKNGKRFVITRGVEFYPNISPTNKFGKMLQSWSGAAKALTKEQLQQWANGIEAGKVVGLNAQIRIVHSTAKSSGNDSAVIDLVMPAAEGAPKILVSSDYVSFLERQKAWRNQASTTPTFSAPGQAPATAAPSAPIEKDDVIPF